MSGMYDEPQSSDVKLTPYPFNIEGRNPSTFRASQPVDYLNSGEQCAREMQIEIESIKLLRQDVIHCYRKEGVNHYANCRKPVDAYVKAISGLDIGRKKKE